MNTYSEILQTTVLDSLQSQYLVQTNLRSQVNAAMFSLYYAQGATPNQVQMEKSYAMIAQELNNAQASLSTAQEKLAKLQLVLTAANAAINGPPH